MEQVDPNYPEQLHSKYLQIREFKKTIPQVILIVLIFVFVAPFFPHHRLEKVVAEKGYWGTVIWGAGIMAVVLPVAFRIRYLNLMKELEDLQKKVDRINK